MAPLNALISKGRRDGMLSSSELMAALEKMDADIKNDPAYNPSAEVIAKCEVYLDLGDKTDLFNQLWEKVKLN